MLRNGDICQIGRPYDKVIHVGHSFGSIQSYWLSARYPENTDGVILTGFSAASQFLAYIIAGMNMHSARLNQPLRFGDASADNIRWVIHYHGGYKKVMWLLNEFLMQSGIDTKPSDEWSEILTTEIMDLVNEYVDFDSDDWKPVYSYHYPPGYMTTSCFTAFQYGFLQPGNYDVQLGLHAERTKQPVTTGELLTLASAPKSSSFTGPVLVINGENDVPFCGGNCYGQIEGANFSNIPEAVGMAFPSASAFFSYIQPNTGHGLNLHYNATAGYQVMQDFLAANGLSA
ncbi:hypothetical protein ACJQWK_10464 [Exserohilum turcicum]